MLKPVRGLVFFLLYLGLAVLAAGCGGHKEPPKINVPASGGSGEKVIKVAFIAPLTGDVQRFGESTKNGFMLALEKANFTAGSYKIEPVIEDDANDPDKAVTAATKLIKEDKVKAIVGSISARTTIPVSQLANENKVVMITGLATNEKVTVADGKRKDFVFRACFIDPLQGTVDARFALEKLKARTAAILYSKNNDYTAALANSFKDNFMKGGGEIVAYESYSPEKKDLPAALGNIARKNPDVLFLPDYFQNVNALGKQAREKGITARFLGGDIWDSNDLDFSAMDGSYFCNHFSADDPRQEVKDWVELYNGKYGSAPDVPATLTYDATNLLLNAIKTADSDDPEKIKDALQNTRDFTSVSGKITFDPNGNPIKPVVIMQVKNGRYIYADTIMP